MSSHPITLKVSMGVDCARSPDQEELGGVPAGVVRAVHRVGWARGFAHPDFGHRRFPFGFSLSPRRFQRVRARPALRGFLRLV